MTADDPPDDQSEDRAWAAPEAPPATATTPVDPPGDPGGASAERAASGPVPRPAPLRPMTMGDLLDGGFNVLRARPRTVLALAAVFVVPVQLVVSFLNRDALVDVEVLVEESLAGAGGGPATGASSLGALLSFVGGSIGQTFIAAGLAVMVSHWYAGHDPGLREVLARLRGRAGALLVGWTFVHLLQFLGLFAFGVGSLVVMAFYLVTAPAIVVEGLGGFKGMGRSASLTGRRFWFALAFGVLSGLVATVLGTVLGVLPQLLGVVLGPDLGWIALGVGTIITQMVATTVVGAATVLAYLDLRIRAEGLDLAYRADQQLPA